MTLTHWYNDELQSLDPQEKELNLDKYMSKEFQVRPPRGSLSCLPLSTRLSPCVN